MEARLDAFATMQSVMEENHKAVSGTKNRTTSGASLPVIPDKPPVVDPFLWELVHRADRDACHTGRDSKPIALVLHTGGAVVCGELIGEREYFDAISKEIARHYGGAVAERREQMRKAVLSHSITGATEVPDALDDIHQHYFIHLKNVTTHIGTAQFKAPLWRGKLAAVEGYTFGAAN